MKQVNFAVMLGLALLTVYFTLENTSATTVNIVPGVSTSLPLPALLLVAAGIGALGAWLFAGWSGMLRKADILEIENSKKRIQELEIINSNQNNILPFIKFPTSKYIDKDVA